MDALDRAYQMMNIQQNQLPYYALQYLKYMFGKFAVCAEISLTAFAHYAQAIERLECKDNNYKLTSEDRLWFKEHFKDFYFIVLDEAPIKRSPTPKYDLMFGDPDSAIGTLIASHKTIKNLIQKVPKGEIIYRVYLLRTDGKKGVKLLKNL